MRDKDSEIDGGKLSRKPITIGDRVGAVRHTDQDGRMHVFGYGVLESAAIVGREAGGSDSALARFEGTLVPRIILDDGRIVWGTECHLAREDELRVFAEETGRVVPCDIDELRVKAPKYLVIKFFIPPDRQIKNLPVHVSDETFQRMEVLESLGRNLHLEGEYLSRPKQFTITLSDHQEDLEIEIVTSMGEPYEDAIRRIIERAHKRLVACA